MNTQIQTQIETVNPTIATAYLSTNTKNQRNVTINHVNHLTQQMESGQWLLTGEPIIFDKLGKLINGQHRMHAVVKSGASIQFLVIRGVEPESFMAIDRGKTRTNGNIFAINGTQNSTLIASATMGVINYRRALLANEGKGGSLNSAVRASSGDVLHEYNQHPSEYDYTASIVYKTKKLIAPSVCATVASLAMIDAGHNKEFVMHFWESFVTGAGLNDGDPILTFRNKIAENNSAKSKLPKNILTMMTVKAWNCYAENKQAKFFRVMMGEPVVKVK